VPRLPAPGAGGSGGVRPGGPGVPEGGGAGGAAGVVPGRAGCCACYPGCLLSAGARGGCRRSSPRLGCAAGWRLSGLWEGSRLQRAPFLPGRYRLEGFTEWSGLVGTSVGHPAQPPGEAGSPRAGCTAPRPGGAGISPEKETPQPLWAVSVTLGSLFQCSVFCDAS